MAKLKMLNETAIGHVEAIEREVRGSTLSSAASIGATTLDLDSTSWFDEGGGKARLLKKDGSAEEIVVYTQVDDDAGTLTLDPGTTLAWSQDDEIQLYPKSTIKYAHVAIDDAEGDVVIARVRHALRPAFPLGIRDPEDREPVELQVMDGEWVLVDLIGSDETETGELTAEGGGLAPFVWSKKGAIFLGVQDHRPQMTFGGLLQTCTATTGDEAGDEPDGADLILSILFDGVEAAEITIADGTTQSGLVLPDEFIITAGDIMEVEAVQVGSISPGREVTVSLAIAPGVDDVGGRVVVPGPQGDPGMINEVQDGSTPVTDAPILAFTGEVGVSSDGTKITVNVPSRSLNDLTDVDTDTTPPTDGQGLIYDDSLGLWVPGTVGSGGGGDTIIKATADFGHSTTSFANHAPATGPVLKVPVEANKDYWVEFFILYSVDIATTGARFAVNGPASPTLLRLHTRKLSATIGAGGSVTDSFHEGVIGAYDQSVPTTTTEASNAAGTILTALYEGIFANGANAGDLILRVQSEVATSVVTVHARSIVKYREI